ncbi:hypothetical protein H4R21_002955 [Coemansia helicoidea]|uniref:Uncharacterized protein n=1 Tax=Coemansia helicoidea TaxID=1286919 RepID=A0ACC1L444_9FUNG|nr:hypothetical protein H4R21_002955 [Coemansia helicoidea]
MIRLCLLALACAIFTVSNVSALRIARRDEGSAIRSALGGVLVKNGMLTSCELAVLDTQAAVVAASCLDFTGSGGVDTGTKYTVYLDGGDSGKPANYNVDTVTVHPGYKQSSLANNLAIVQFNGDGSAEQQVPVAPTPNHSWDSTAYGQRTLSGTSGTKWNTLNTAGSGNADDATCKGLSQLYMLNQGDMACSQLTVDSPHSDLSSCAIPYGVYYGILGDRAYLVGLYSHAAVEGGSDLCKYSSETSYFTLLGRYIGFIHATLGRNFDIGDSAFGAKYGDFSPTYGMANDSVNKTIGVSVVTGNVYRDALVDTDDPSGNPGPGSTRDGDSRDGNTRDGDSRDGSSRGGSSRASGASANASRRRSSRTGSGRMSRTGTDGSYYYYDEDEDEGQPGGGGDGADRGEGSDGGPAGSGLSQKGIIIVAVCVSLAGLAMVAVAVFCVCRRPKPGPRPMDPVGIAQVEETFRTELGCASHAQQVHPSAYVLHNADPDYDLPPTYDDYPDNLPTPLSSSDSHLIGRKLHSEKDIGPPKH